MQVFAGHMGPVTCGDFTPDGKRIITADAEGTLIFWDPRSPTPLFKLTPEDQRFALDGITSLAVNPASTLAVVGGSSGGVRVVSLSKGDVVGALAGQDLGLGDDVWLLGDSFMKNVYTAFSFDDNAVGFATLA